MGESVALPDQTDDLDLKVQASDVFSKRNLSFWSHVILNVTLQTLGMHLGSFKDSKVSYYSAVFSAQQLRNHNRTKEAKNDFRHLYAMMRFCYRLLLFFQVLFLVRSVGDNLMTQATGRGTLSAHTEAKGNGPALCVGNQCGRGEPLSP